MSNTHDRQTPTTTNHPRTTQRLVTGDDVVIGHTTYKPSLALSFSKRTRLPRNIMTLRR